MTGKSTGQCVRCAGAAVAAMVAAMAIASTAQAAAKADDAFGVWNNGGARVEVYKCGDDACVKIVNQARNINPKRLDAKNPDSALRKVPVVGLTIMNGAKRQGADAGAGRLYNPDDGKTYTGTITSKSRDQIVMAGCVLSVFCKRLTWNRVKSPTAAVAGPK